MATTGQKVVDDARVILQDAAGTRWADAEMLVWINNGRRDMSLIKPSLWNTLAKRTVTLSAGAYQTISLADAYSLVDVMNNATAADAPTTAIIKVQREQLDTFAPSWRAETGAAVQNWFRDEAHHLSFWVYPAVSGGKIHVNVNVTPNSLGALTETCVPLDVMATTLMHYVLYRAYAKDAEIAANAELSKLYLSLFTAALTA